ncbi:hypothetical protein [Pedobacter insulae]|uniref:DUF4397 domain-containing protein n=1 Tax=Pedobacter insulae TaxID=414048 RepID=A0A1I2TSQ5_9SPHI|nr:hypothetical protein [Pedobacter insulae]SFG67985.1 hypothetical protein SAMN04489864_101574 [Pedobacter insulae]
MKTLNLSLLLVVLFFAMSCKKNADVIDVQVGISVLTADGRNALAAPALYDASNISIYHIVNGQPQLYVTPAVNGGKPFDITGSPGYEKLKIYLHFDRSTPTTLTLIKFGNSKMDTISGEFRFVDSSVYLEKAWFNGVSKPKAFNIVR